MLTHCVNCMFHFLPNHFLPFTHPLPILFLLIQIVPIVPATFSLSKLYLRYRLQSAIMGSTLGKVKKIEEVCDAAEIPLMHMAADIKLCLAIYVMFKLKKS